MCGYVEQLSPKGAQGFSGAGSCLDDCHTGDQPAPKTQMDKGMFSTGGDRTGPGLHGFRPCFPCHLQSFFWIHDVLSLLEMLLMKLAISFLRLLYSQLKFMEAREASTSFTVNLSGIGISALAPQKRIGMFPNPFYPSAPSDLLA